MRKLFESIGMIIVINLFCLGLAYGYALGLGGLEGLFCALMLCILDVALTWAVIITTEKPERKVKLRNPVLLNLADIPLRSSGDVTALRDRNKALTTVKERNFKWRWDIETDDEDSVEYTRAYLELASITRLLNK